jgi:hypothetical protein
MCGNDGERRKQVAAGVVILLVLTVLVSGALIGWRYLPGLLGEWMGVVIGVMSTPFLLEISFGILGLMVVLMLNHWRQKRAGDELVYLEEVKDPDGLPDHARWAVYQKQPLSGEEPSLLVQADGALALGDYEMATECLAAMPEEQLKLPETLRLRLQLARATGKTDLVEKLATELAGARHGDS